MQSAVEKFSRYTSNIDSELQKIIQSLLSLIECKTKTVKKLIQLHSKIQKVKDATGKFQSSYFKKESRTDYSFSNDSIVDITTFTETASVLCHEDTRRLRSVGKEDDKPHENSRTSDRDRESKDPIQQPNDSKSNFLASDNKADQVRNVKTQHLKTSCVVTNIKSALDCLQECQQGDCGVTMDVCSYKNLIDMLKTVLESYNHEKQTNSLKSSKENSLKIEVGKRSTHPSLRETHRETPKRLSCSSTEFRQTGAKKLRG